MKKTKQKHDPKKYNRPHRCSVCGLTGHRKETCKKIRKVIKKGMKQAMKVVQSRLDKATKYKPTESKEKVLLKTIKQKPYEEILSLSREEAKKMLTSFGVLPKVSETKRCKCWSCGEDMTKVGEVGSVSFRCQKRSCGTRCRNSDLAWTPLYHWARGGHDASQLLVRAIYILSLKIPTDAAQHLLGVSYDAAENIFKMLKVALAHAELSRGRDITFPTGTVEMDAAATNIKRDKKTNKHCGRFIVVYHRETQQYSLEPLPDKEVKKGAPPPPESVADVQGIMARKLTKGHILCTDSAQAYKQAAKKSPVAVPHATVVHQKKNFTRVVHFPTKHLSSRLQKLAAKLPTSSSRTLRVRAGDQGAEAVFGSIKRNIARLNLKSSTKTATVNFLAAAFLHKNTGFEEVARGVAEYRRMITGSTSPSTAFKDTAWLTNLEAVA
jgi:hypothetical protein